MAPVSISHVNPAPQEVDAVTTYKIVLVGDGGVGKSTLVKKHLTSEFSQHYVATLGVEVHPLTFHTNHGTLRFNMWDTAGQEQFGGLKDGYYILGEAAIVMCAVDDESSIERVDIWRQSLLPYIPEDKIIVVNNKCDLDGDSFYQGDSIPISVQNGYNIYEPFLELARRLTGHENLIFV